MGTGLDRNKQCHCGSGKKYKNCCLHQDAATRYRGISFRVDKPTLVTGYALNSDGRIQLLNGDGPIEVSDVKTVEWRSTENGLKEKSSLSVTHGDAFFDLELALQNANYVFGVDTNSIKTENEILNVSCLTCATRSIMAPDFEGTIQQIMCIDFSDDEEVAEKIGWLAAIEVILKSSPDANAKIFLCTDHAANEHAAINRREVPILKNYYLPPNFTIFYARDKGNTVQNKIIKAAHKGASKVISEIVENDIEGQKILPYLLKQSEKKPRHWRNDNNKHEFFD